MNKKKLTTDKPLLKNGNKKQQIAMNFLFRYLSVLIFVFAFLSFIFGIFYIILPKYNSIKDDITSTNTAKEREKEDMELYLLKLNSYLNNFNKISDQEKERIDILLPDSGQVEYLLVNMESLVRKRGLMLLSLSVVEQKKTDENKVRRAKESESENIGLPTGVSAVTIEMEIMGADYNSLKELLKEIENNLRILDIEQINFSPEGGSLSLEMTSYYRDN